MLLLAQTAWARPDFSRSTITADPSVVTEGDVVTFVVTARNSGDEEAPSVDIDVDMPLEGMFVDFDGPSDVIVDARGKALQAVVALAPGAERSFRFRMVIPRDSGGNRLSARLLVRSLYHRAEHHADSVNDIQTRVGSGWITIGGVTFHPVLVGLLALLASYPVLRFLISSRTRSHGPPFAIVLSTGFLGIFVMLFVRDWQIVYRWHDSVCIITDTRLREDTMSSSKPRAPGTGRQTGASQNTVYTPVLALRFDANGREVVSTGFDTGSRLSIGGIGGALQEFSRWPPGAAVPCRFDPENPTNVVVIPGFGGAYVFALFPLALLAAGIWGVVGREK